VSKQNIYQLSKHGERAVNNDVFQNAFPAMVTVLSKCLKRKSGFEPWLLEDSQESLDMLVEIGLLEKRTDVMDEPVKEASASSLELIKRDFAALLKKDLSAHEKFWDVLLNIEIVTDKDGLIWFMSQIADISNVFNKQEYRVLFKQLMELKNG